MSPSPHCKKKAFSLHGGHPLSPNNGKWMFLCAPFFWGSEEEEVTLSFDASQRQLGCFFCPKGKPPPPPPDPFPFFPSTENRFFSLFLPLKDEVFSPFRCPALSPFFLVKVIWLCPPSRRSMGKFALSFKISFLVFSVR